jgi:anti-anti-sigma factor
VLLDLAGTTYVDSTGTALLAGLAGELRVRRGVLVVVAPRGSLPRRVFEVSGVAPLLELREERGAGWPGDAAGRDAG